MMGDQEEVDEDVQMEEDRLTDEGFPEGYPVHVVIYKLRKAVLILGSAQACGCAPSLACYSSQ